MDSKYDPQQARYIRKQHAKNGFDEDEEQQQQDFNQNIQSALNNHSKKVTTKSVEQQIQYFGYAMQPFNMRQEEQMGQVDEEGFFVMNRNKRGAGDRDAWLDSIDQGNDEMVIDTVKKKIKEEGQRFQTVYEADDKINEDLKEDDRSDDSNEDAEDDDKMREEGMSQQEEDKPMGHSLSPLQLKQLIVELIPKPKQSANQYLRELKKISPNNFKKHPENKELHDQILDLCNIYIEKTTEYDILTKKREELENQCADADEGVAGDEQKQLNWDDSEQEHQDQKPTQNDQVLGKASSKQQQHQPASKTAQNPERKTNQPKAGESDDNDDIF